MRGNERTPDPVCRSCREGYHECSVETDAISCSCWDCVEARAEREQDAAEFFNGLEDFFKSIDPDRVGWETIEAEAFLGDEGDLHA